MKFPVWQISPKSSFNFRFFEDRCVVYDEGSGQTIILSVLAASVISALELGPKSPIAIEDFVSDLLVQDRFSIRHSLTDTITELSELGLIFPTNAGRICTQFP